MSISDYWSLYNLESFKNKLKHIKSLIPKQIETIQKLQKIIKKKVGTELLDELLLNSNENGIVS